MVKRSLKKVLIANRGEIARRIQRACHALDIDTVSVASEADSNTLFSREADKLEIIGPPPAAQSYLKIDKLVEIAIDTGCDGVHPGYGFLSENADFARAVNKAGLIFIGPDPETIELLGNKTLARERVTLAGVPCTPGTGGGLSDDELIGQAATVGYPLLIKAAAGGGGRGMRVVEKEADLEAALKLARSEAVKNFGSDEVFFERYLLQPRHVEVQIFGDEQGNIVHFGTRDCSLQRRHQKLIEEAPAPDLAPELRERIHQAALRAARGVGYKNAGTVEFLIRDNEFFFLEINTRIQVEHPVTEQITGVDLVQLQLKVAAGEPISLKQREITFSGHAIEFRINAEDPGADFRPEAGQIAFIGCKESAELPEYVREDRGFDPGDTISIYYDSLVSKVVVQGESRRQALERSLAFLRGYSVEGLKTNLPFHLWALRLSPFQDGPLDIGFVEREFSANSVGAVAASLIRDPLHRPASGGVEAIDSFRYESRRFQRSYEIEVIHNSSGDFLARPKAGPGQRARTIYCRASNGLQAALNALTAEVLEKVPPAEIFQEVAPRRASTSRGA